MFENRTGLVRQDARSASPGSRESATAHRSTAPEQYRPMDCEQMTDGYVAQLGLVVTAAQTIVAVRDGLPHFTTVGTKEEAPIRESSLIESTPHPCRTAAQL